MTRGGVKSVASEVRVVPVEKKKKIYHRPDTFITALINVLVRDAEGDLFIPSLLVSFPQGPQVGAVLQSANRSEVKLALCLCDGCCCS